MTAVRDDAAPSAAPPPDVSGTARPSEPGVVSIVRLIAGYTVGRLSAGTVMLAMLLTSRQGAGLAEGSLAVALYTAGVACSAPTLGRLIDRHGARVLLPGLASAYAAALCCLAVAGASRVWLFVALAAVAGVVAPPFAPAVRGALTRTFTDPARRSRLLSLEGTTLESIYLIGPLLVALCALESPRLALVLTGATALGGALVVAGVRWLPGPATVEARRGRGGMRTVLHRRVLGFLALLFCVTGALSALDVGLVAYAGPHRTALSGVLLAVLGAASLLSGVVTSIWPMPSTPARRLVAGSAVLTTGCLALLLPVGVPAFGVLLGIAALAIAPTMAALLVTLGDAADGPHVSEIFAWAGSANFVAIAVWTGTAGWLGQHLGARSVLLLAAAGLTVAVGVAAALARRSPVAEAAAPAPQPVVFAAVPLIEDAVTPARAPVPAYRARHAHTPDPVAVSA